MNDFQLFEDSLSINLSILKTPETMQSHVDDSFNLRTFIVVYSNVCRKHFNELLKYHLMKWTMSIELRVFFLVWNFAGFFVLIDVSEPIGNNRFSIY